MFYVYMLQTFYVRFTYPYLAMLHRGIFLKYQAYLDYGPVPRPTLKWPCASLVRLMGCARNTVD